MCVCICINIYIYVYLWPPSIVHLKLRRTPSLADLHRWTPPPTSGRRSPKTMQHHHAINGYKYKKTTTISIAIFISCQNCQKVPKTTPELVKLGKPMIRVNHREPPF